jgi:Phage portal protein
MKIGSLNISRVKPSTTETIVKSNSYEQSVASALQSKFGSGTVKANGRSVNKGYSAEELSEIYRGYIYAAIRKTRNKVADILVNNIEVYDPNEGNPKDAPALEGVKHPYLEAIHRSPVDDTLFYAGIASFIMILGEAFVDAGERTMMAGNIKPVGQFELLQSNRVLRTYDDDGKTLKAYKLTTKLPNGLDDIELFVPSNVIALMDLNPTDLRKGYGMIRPVVDENSLETMATRLQIATISNMIKAPGILSSKEKLEADDYSELKNSVETRWTSNDMDKAGTPIVTNGGFIEYESLIEDLDKLAMQKIRGLNRDAFFAVLGVSKTILGIEESGTTRDVSKTQTDNFILDTVMPLVNSILNGFNQDYINNYPKDYAAKPLKMRAIAPISKDLEQEKSWADIQKLRAETYKVFIEAGVDPDQAAKLADLELDDNEKMIMVEKPAPQNMITLTTEQLALLRNSPDGETPKVIINNNKQPKEVHHHDPKDVAQTAKNTLNDRDQTRLAKAEATLRTNVRELDTMLGEATQSL